MPKTSCLSRCIDKDAYVHVGSSRGMVVAGNERVTNLDKHSSRRVDGALAATHNVHSPIWDVYKASLTAAMSSLPAVTPSHIGFVQTAHGKARQENLDQKAHGTTCFCWMCLACTLQGNVRIIASDEKYPQVQDLAEDRAASLSVQSVMKNYYS